MNSVAHAAVGAFLFGPVGAVIRATRRANGGGVGDQSKKPCAVAADTLGNARAAVVP
jgi:hypothetical protein